MSSISVHVLETKFFSNGSYILENRWNKRIELRELGDFVSK